MGLVRILGIIVLIGLAYGILKEFGVTEIIKKIVGGFVLILFGSAAIAVLAEKILKADLATAFSTTFNLSIWIIAAFLLFKLIRRIVRR